MLLYWLVPGFFCNVTAIYYTTLVFCFLISITDVVFDAAAVAVVAVLVVVVVVNVAVAVVADRWTFCCKCCKRSNDPFWQYTIHIFVCACRRFVQPDPSENPFLSLSYSTRRRREDTISIKVGSGLAIWRAVSRSRSTLSLTHLSPASRPDLTLKRSTTDIIMAPSKTAEPQQKEDADSMAEAKRVWQSLVNCKTMTEPQVEQFYENWAKSVQFDPKLLTLYYTFTIPIFSCSSSSWSWHWSWCDVNYLLFIMPKTFF